MEIGFTNDTGWFEFPVNPADAVHGKDRREMVIPADHAVRRLGQYGVYMYFDGQRCLYVGKASASTLVGRALDYLYEAGGRPEVYRVIRKHATKLMIRGVSDDAAARRLELAEIVAREPVLNEGFIYASPEEKTRYGLGPSTAVAAAVQVSGLKIHAAIWLAAALLHEQGQATFSPARLAEEVERRFGDVRPGVKTHIHAHCVANAPLNTTVEYNYLCRTEIGELRLFRRGDQLHPSRSSNRLTPDQSDVPAELWPVWRKWQ